MYCRLKHKCGCGKQYSDNSELIFGGEQFGCLLFHCTCKSTLSVRYKDVDIKDEYLNYSEVGMSLGITRQGVYYLINSKKLRKVNVNGVSKVHYKDFAEFLFDKYEREQARKNYKK